jgi:hypothetical protein
LANIYQEFNNGRRRERKEKKNGERRGLIAFGKIFRPTKNKKKNEGHCSLLLCRRETDRIFRCWRRGQKKNKF